MSKYNVGLKTLLLQGLSEPEFYGDLLYKFRKMVKMALLFWFFMVVLLSVCLRNVSIVATCIAVHFAVCHALYNNKNKKIGKNRCLVFLNALVLFCSVILS